MNRPTDNSTFDPSQIGIQEGGPHVAELSEKLKCPIVDETTSDGRARLIIGGIHFSAVVGGRFYPSCAVVLMVDGVQVKAKALYLGEKKDGEPLPESQFFKDPNGHLQPSGSEPYAIVPLELEAIVRAKVKFMGLRLL